MCIIARNFFAAVTIGFDPNTYTVNEPDGSVILMVHLISGVLEREVIVNFETSPGSATGNFKINKIYKYTVNCEYLIKIFSNSLAYAKIKCTKTCAHY